MNNKIINLIEKSFNENKNSHAFLIETNNLNKSLNDVVSIIKNINIINYEIDLENIPDVKVIYPDGKEIKKEQISEILEKFQTFPVELKHKYYVVIQSELMNQSSANKVLKFLEEPDNDVIGFFITENKNAMINTIVSRCQHYKLFYENVLSLEEDKINEFLSKMNQKEIYSKIIFLNIFFSKERNENIIFLKNLKKFLLINKNLLISDIKILVKRISLLDNVIERLMKNSNQELIILDLARNWK